MKKLVYFMAAVAVLAVSLTSCKKDKEDDPQEESVTLKIAVSDVTASAASVVVTPSNNTTAYYFDVLDKASFEEYSSDADLVADYVAYFEEMIEEYAEIGYDLTLADFFSTGEDSYDFSGLTANTDYYAIAFAYDVTNKKLIGSVQKQAFKTSEMIMSDMTFDIEYVDGNLTVTPSNDTDAWDYALMSVEEFEEYYGSDADEAAADSYAYYGEDYAAPGEYTFSAEELAEGELEDGTAYVIIVYGANGGVNTEVAKYEFTYVAADADGGEGEEEAQTRPVRRFVRK